MPFLKKLEENDCQPFEINCKPLQIDCQPFEKLNGLGLGGAEEGFE